MAKDQDDKQVIADLNPEKEDEIMINLNQPEDAEPSNEEESIGDENEPLP